MPSEGTTGETYELVPGVPFRLHRTDKSRLSQVDFHNLPFGKVFSDHMFVAEYRNGKWQNFRIEPYRTLQFTPAMIALHYGQIIFEGMKAFRTVDGKPVLFRPEKNIQRMKRSAERMAMPPFPEDLFLAALKELVWLDREWIPPQEDSALYIRPMMFATDEYIGVRPSETYWFIIFTCPVGPYYPEPVRVLIEREYVRAFPGGTGDAKAGGNYGASLMPARRAQQKGYHQLLWTDGHEHRWVEEIGTMNVFFVIDGEVVTPPLTGTILPGVTRDSVITLCREEGIPVAERPIAIEELFAAYEEGKLQDAFGTGTAATITPIAEIAMEREDGTVARILLPPVQERTLSARLKQRLEAIRRGLAPDPFGWVLPAIPERLQSTAQA